jgi:hypothetical protein
MINKWYRKKSRRKENPGQLALAMELQPRSARPQMNREPEQQSETPHTISADPFEKELT